MNIAAIVELFGQATLGLGSLLGKGLELPLYDWRRKSELSADRAALPRQEPNPELPMPR